MKGLLFSTLIVSSTLLFAGQPAPQKAIDWANSDLKKVVSSSGILNAVKEQNKKQLKIEWIKEKDAVWAKTPGTDDFMKTHMSGPCYNALVKLKKDFSFVDEAFVMDNQGANVCMLNKTSDYWQGDEGKFVKSYNDGKGNLFADEVKFDDSAQNYLVQISIPVMDGSKAIGAITVGINLDNMK